MRQLGPHEPVLLAILAICILLLLALFAVALWYRREMRKLAESDPRPLGEVTGVDVAAWVEIGEIFEFGSSQKMDLNDVIGIEWYRDAIPYGLAKIVEVGPGGFYKARRID